MAYKISGSTEQPTRIIIINESDWSIENNTVENGDYEIIVTTGPKAIIGRLSDGRSVGFGNISPSIVSGGDRGVFVGGFDNISGINDTMDYVTISTTGDATDFGDQSVPRYYTASTSNGALGRGISGAGYTTTEVNIIDYFTISNPGNTNDFGDLLAARFGFASVSNNTLDRGVFAGGRQGSFSLNEIEYLTISTTSNSSNFGDLTSGTRYATGAVSNAVNNRGVFDSGYLVNNMDYITISTVSNASNFGDLTLIRRDSCAVSNATNERGVFCGGYNSTNYYNAMDYITINSVGNAADFGDVDTTLNRSGATSNGSDDRGVIGGGQVAGDGIAINVIRYITISSTGNTQDFGDLTFERRALSATSNA